MADKTNQELAEEYHEEIMGLLQGEMGLVNPNINRATETKLVVTVTRHKEDTLIDLVSNDTEKHAVSTTEKIPKQPRDMYSYSSVEITKTE